MEIKVCSFIAENNLPISLCESLLPLLRSLFPSDSVLKQVKLGKQKATNTIRQRDRFSVALYATEERSPEDEKL